jgi:hypothetical protein
VDRLPSAVLVSALIAVEGHPWAEWNRGKGLSTNGVARLLAPFGIAPGTIRINNNETPKATNSRNSRMPLRATCLEKSFEPPQRHNIDGTGIS